MPSLLRELPIQNDEILFLCELIGVQPHKQKRDLLLTEILNLLVQRQSVIHVEANREPRSLNRRLEKPMLCSHFRYRQHEQLVEEGKRLTERQREVLQLLAEGKVMREVASILNVTPRTVAFHKYRIKEVLGATSNADLVKYALRNHLIT
jgi:DNA-binding NarL/FixJ family response regulator